MTQQVLTLQWRPNHQPKEKQMVSINPPDFRWWLLTSAHVILLWERVSKMFQHLHGGVSKLL